MHNYLHNKLPNSFENKFTQLSSPNRTKGFVIDRIKNNFLSQFPNYFLPKNWNSNSLVLKNISTINSFKNNLKKHILASYSPVIRCNSDNCPDCH